VSVIYGVNPVIEAMRGRKRPVERIGIALGVRIARYDELMREAKAARVAIVRQPTTALDRAAGGRNHQGVIAWVGAARFASLAEVVARMPERRLAVLLDGVEDPHNLGAIIRTALAAGAHGVVIPERRAAGLTDTVARSSAGALAHLPVAKVTNLARTMEELKEAGYWLVGLDEHADKRYTEVDYTSPTAIVMGGEDGMHELTRKRCDFVVSLPTTGPVKSLNVSVATGVVLFEALRQRQKR